VNKRKFTEWGQPKTDFYGVRRETGKEQMVQVHCGEGVANHTDPELSAVYREVCGEAWQGSAQASQGADAYNVGEGNREGGRKPALDS
jgi:hypothetical protein